MSAIRNDSNAASTVPVQDWIEMNDRFWSEDLNPALIARGMEPLTPEQIGTMVHILIEELVVRSERQFHDLLVIKKP